VKFIFTIPSKKSLNSNSVLNKSFSKFSFRKALVVEVEAIVSGVDVLVVEDDVPVDEISTVVAELPTGGVEDRVEELVVEDDVPVDEISTVVAGLPTDGVEDRVEDEVPVDEVAVTGYALKIYQLILFLII